MTEKVCGVAFEIVSGTRTEIFGLGRIVSSCNGHSVSESQKSIVFRSSHQLSVITRFYMTAKIVTVVIFCFECESCMPLNSSKKDYVCRI